MNISIRPWEMSDDNALAHVLNDPAVLCRLRDGIPYPYTASDARQYIEAVNSFPPGEAFSRAIVADGTVVGCVGAFRETNIHFRTAELGYYLAREHWGKGIMTQAVGLLCDELFASTDLMRIFAIPFASNFGSRRVLEKAGFTLEGIMKYNAFKDGKLMDTAMYAMIRKEN